MAGVRDHTELHVWQLSDRLYQRVVEILRRPGFDAHPALRAQMARSSESPGSHIAEGFARYHPRDNARFVQMAKGSLNECRSQLKRAHGHGLLSDAEWEEANSIARRAMGAATRYMAYLSTARAPGSPRPQRSSRRPPRQL
jgi:four helix bundle protein